MSDAVTPTLVEQPVLNCPLLRGAVYRNRTSSRALRHNIALSCVPVAMLPAVAPWLPPWDVVPPEAALRGLRSLEIIRRSAGPISKDTLHDLAVSMERIAPQLVGVTSLTLRFPSTITDELGGEPVLRRVLRCLPALQSLTLSSARSFCGDSVVQPGVELGDPGDALAYLEHAPRLTALDIRCVPQRQINQDQAEMLLMKSLLCSRLSLRTIATHSVEVLKVLLMEFSGVTPRLASDRPHYTPFTAEEVKEINAQAPSGVVPLGLLKLHSPAWTLRSFTLELHYRYLPLGDMCRFVLACPELRFMKLVWRPNWMGREWTRNHPLQPAEQPEQERPWHETAAHAAVLRVAAAVREQHPALRGMAPAHAASLAAMVAEEQYPATLSLVFARGFDLTTLERVDVHGAVGAEHGAIDAAMEAARLLRQWKQGQ